ncbi:MAG: RNA 2',3'-cyclic phosphodiesterase [Planctomycetota bacterium]
MARVFVAIDLDEPLRRALRSCIERQLIQGSSVHWVRPEGIHLTLKFLGEIEEIALDPVTRAVVEASRGIEPFEVGVRGLGFFPGIQNPRVFWAGVEPHASLERLARAVDERLAPLGFPREKKRFHGHLTLARIKGRPQPVDPAIVGSEPIFGTLDVSEVVVMESELARSGARYTRVATAPLGVP